MRWKQFTLDLIKRKDDLNLPNAEEDTVPSEITIDLDRVESFYRYMDEDDEMTSTRIGMFNGDGFVVNADYEEVKKLINKV